MGTTTIATTAAKADKSDLFEFLKRRLRIQKTQSSSKDRKLNESLLETRTTLNLKGLKFESSEELDLLEIFEAILDEKNAICVHAINCSNTACKFLVKKVSRYLRDSRNTRLREITMSNQEKGFREDCDREMFLEAIECTEASIERMNLASCDLDDRFVLRLCEALRARDDETSSLKQLNLRNNKRITDVALESIWELASSSVNGSNLVDVNVSGGVFSDVAKKKLDHVLEQNAVGCLRRKMSCTTTNDDDDDEGLACSCTYALSNCEITDDILMHLYDDIVSKTKKKIIADVRNNKITEDGFKRFYEKYILNDNDKNGSGIIILQCDGNPGFASQWCKRLRALCAFNDLFAKYSSELLEKNKKGEAMRSLGELGFGCEGCEVISSLVLKQMPVLESIGLHHNEINDKGCEYLGRLLFEKHENMREVALYGNKIGATGTRSVTDAFVKRRKSNSNNSKGLEILDFGGNPIGNEGVRAIAELIMVEESLVEVHVDHVGIDEEGAIDLKNALETRLKIGKPMRTIWAHGNNITDDLLTSITNLCRAGASVLENEKNSLNCCENDIDVEEDDENDNASKYQPKPVGDFDFEICEREALEATNVNKDEKSPSSYDSRLKSNRIASYAFNAYKRFCKRHYENAKGAACFAAFVAFEKSTSRIKVTSLGVGTKFVPSDVAGCSFVAIRDDVVRDSHAEILARRNFVRYLYGEMNEKFSGVLVANEEEDEEECKLQKGGNEFEILEFCNVKDEENDDDDKGLFRKRDDVEIHLYVSTAPCGAASFNGLNGSSCCFEHATSKGTQTRLTKNVQKVPPGCVILSKGVSEAIGNSKKTLSCSDKIALWCARGVQGSILRSTFIKEPIVLSSVTCSRKFDKDRIFQATFGRLSVSSPSSSSTPIDHQTRVRMATISIEFKERHGTRADVGESDESISWCSFDKLAYVHDGRTGLPISGRGKPSRASKQNMKEEFLNLLLKKKKIASAPSSTAILKRRGREREEHFTSMIDTFVDAWDEIFADDDARRKSYRDLKLSITSKQQQQRRTRHYSCIIPGCQIIRSAHNERWLFGH